jgi:HrpA-like RNA helicase
MLKLRHCMCHVLSISISATVEQSTLPGACCWAYYQLLPTRIPATAAAAAPLPLLLPRGPRLRLFPLHSSVDIDEAMAAMQQAVEPGSRKVILATNVAGDKQQAATTPAHVRVLKL